jgi:hypothetical protein
LSTAAAAAIGQALALFEYGIVGGTVTVPSILNFAESNKVFSGGHGRWAAAQRKTAGAGQPCEMAPC